MYFVMNPSVWTISATREMYDENLTHLCPHHITTSKFSWRKIQISHISTDEREQLSAFHLIPADNLQNHLLLNPGRDKHVIAFRKQLVFSNNILGSENYLVMGVEEQYVTALHITTGLPHDKSWLATNTNNNSSLALCHKYIITPRQYEQWIFIQQFFTCKKASDGSLVHRYYMQL